MSAGAAVLLGAGLFLLFLLIVGVLVWQEARRRPGPAEPAYVISEAVAFISARLEAGTLGRLRPAGVQRIIEWEVHYLQGLAQRSRRHPVETVAGGADAAVDYVVTQIADVNGVTYDREDVAEVLRLEAHYLVSIGAVGEAVEPHEFEAGGEQ